MSLQEVFHKWLISPRVKAVQPARKFLYVTLFIFLYYYILMFLLYSHRESNPDLRFRRALFYPLNYKNASPLTLFDSCMYLNILCSYTTFALRIPTKSTVCTLHILCSYTWSGAGSVIRLTVCTLHILCSYTRLTISVNCKTTVCTLHILCSYTRVSIKPGMVSAAYTKAYPLREGTSRVTYQSSR